MKEANKYLRRTQDPKNAHTHKSIVCVICNGFILEQKRFTNCQRITSVLIPKDYAGLKILKMLTNINPFYVSFAMDLLLEQKKITICQRITSVLKPKDLPWKVTKDTMRQCSFLK